jgi:GTP-binding protein HflX
VSAERAALVGLITGPMRRSDADRSLDELAGLATAAGAGVVLRVLQERDRPDAATFLGSGKIASLGAACDETDVDLVVFDNELTPAQLRQIESRISQKVIDRTQLILDIFASRARTREGKLQVELAQLKYLLPRLLGKGTAMSRLAGGIGGRGPGETKLEVDRRRVRKRIRQLEAALEEVRRHRRQLRSQRDKKHLPVISIIGYTNAGKSTLLNSLTKSRVLAERRLFATLDPSSRRLRFPRDIEVIITDTVGFIRDLPQDLMVAFRATLEELEVADLLLHVIDISNPRVEDQIQAVEAILADLHLDLKATLKVFNKKDLAAADRVDALCRRHGAVAIAAVDKTTLSPLIERMQSLIVGLTFPGVEPHRTVSAAPS